MVFISVSDKFILQNFVTDSYYAAVALYLTRGKNLYRITRRDKTVTFVSRLAAAGGMCDLLNLYKLC